MPFLAPALPFIMGGLGAAGAVAKGRASGRAAENDANQNADMFRLRAAEFNRQNPTYRSRDAVRGDLLAGLQPFRLSGEGRNISSTGGVSPALLTQGTRDLGKSMNRDAVLSQLGGLNAQPQKAKSMKELMTPQAPQRSDPYAMLTPTPLKQPGLLDKILGGAGLAGGLIGSLGGLKIKGGPLPGFDDPENVGFD